MIETTSDPTRGPNDAAGNSTDAPTTTGRVTGRVTGPVTDPSPSTSTSASPSTDQSTGPTDAELAAQAPRTRRNHLALLIVPLVVIPAVAIWFGAPAWVPFALGAAGWMIALVLRQPVALVASRMTTRDRAGLIVGWFSGPAEEIVRVILVLLLIHSGVEALWAGLGWATIEVLLAVVNGFVIASLLTKTDAKSMEAKEILRAQGMTASPTGPGWGMLERLSATAMHVGFTLILFAQPWLVIATIVVHSASNMAAVRYAKRSVAATELGLVVLSAILLIAGLTLNGVF